jgi:hypothetical protein
MVDGVTKGEVDKVYGVTKGECTNVDGNPSIHVETDKKNYEQGDTVQITGTVGGFDEYTEPVGITVEGPEYTHEENLDTDGSFGFNIKDMQGPAGKYTVTAYYSEDLDASTTFVLEADPSIPLSLTVVTNKNGYEQKETVRITGTVGGFKVYDGQVKITVNDPDDVAKYTGQVGITVNRKDPLTTGGTFEYDIQNIQGKEGKYTVTAYYNDHVARTSFVLAPVLPPPFISVKTDNANYDQGNTVKITGTVGGFGDHSGLVGITVKGPQGNITYNGNPTAATDGTFNYDIEGIQGKEGKYTVTAYYSDLVAHTTFDLAAEPPIPIPPIGSGKIASNETPTSFPSTKISPPLTTGLPAAPSLSPEFLGLIMIIIIGAGATLFHKIKSHHPEIKPPVVTVEIRGGETY